MRKLIACVFNYSLDGLLADPDTGFWDFCFSRPDDPVEITEQAALFDAAEAHIMGRVAYEGMSRAMPTSDRLFAPGLNAGRKFVFSTTMKTAEWNNTTVVSGDTIEEVDRIRRGGDGHVIVWGGVRMWRTLMERDLIDEFHVDMYPYVAGRGTRLFDGFLESYPLDLVSSTGFRSGITLLKLRRPR
ncbi:dihydrofolate reductase [Stackebrandtia albiflava]|uniref:Dihydrofolate reductase n=1 Tax=Stackebrandtia albiflava TaxID=406432 RepID=A0A562V9H4_9ACTN|nr:dihydrofolate reductase family protein [Stackebrandtia albiflava]TWJ14535.1 dihydrofolate reductase [Stackebrandtia albiflava]